MFVCERVPERDKMQKYMQSVAVDSATVLRSSQCCCFAEKGHCFERLIDTSMTINRFSGVSIFWPSFSTSLLSAFQLSNNCALAIHVDAGVCAAAWL